MGGSPTYTAGSRVFFAGTAIFLTGTTLCGFARSMELLIVFRAIQGIGAGAIQPIAMTIIGDVYTPAERARIQGAMSAVWGFAAVVGPAASAFLVETVHWSVVFWVNLPIGAVSLAMFALFLNERVERREHRIDYLGGALLIVGVGALMLALVQGLTLGGPAIAALVATGVGALVLAVRARATDARADAAAGAVAPARAGPVQSRRFRRVGDLHGGQRAAADLCSGRDGLQRGGQRICRRRGVGQLDGRLDRRRPADGPYVVPADLRDRRRLAGRRQRGAADAGRRVGEWRGR